MKKLAALLVSLTMILGTQSVVAEEKTVEEIIDPFSTPVEDENPVFEEEAAERKFLEELTSWSFINI